MMAAERGGGGDGDSASASAPAADYSMLVVVGMVGALRAGGQLERLLLHIESGVRCWRVPLELDLLDQQLKLFVSRHSAFLSEEIPGQRTLQHRGEILDAQVVLNPAHDLVCSEVRRLLCEPSRHKLLVLAGQCVEDSGDVVLQEGLFSPGDLIRICADEEVGLSWRSVARTPKASLTVRCPNSGLWRAPSSKEGNLQDFLTIQVNPPLILPQMEGLQEFVEYLSESLEAESPFELLEPPNTVGFLKLSRPCCYIFPGGRGDAAFFAVNGFNVLVNGGSDARACFWKLVRHLDRIDCVLVTHVGVDNLPGLNSLLLRKVAERDRDRDSAQGRAEEDWLKKLVSPELGVFFLNAPQGPRATRGDPAELRGADQGALILERLEKLSIKARPLCRSNGPSIEPLVLFHKMGVGRLELYPLNPVSGSKELEELLLQTSPKGSTSQSSALPLACLTSVCALLVWHPSSNREKIVRVLFPGCAPQAKILDGLERLKHLDFLRVPAGSSKDLEPSQMEKLPKRAESRESTKGREPRVTGAFQKDRTGRVHDKKPEVKVKPKAAGEAPGSREKEQEARLKPVRPSEKLLPKKEGKKRDERGTSAAVRESLRKDVTKTKKESRAEAKKDGKREDGRTLAAAPKDLRKVAAAPSSEVKRSPVGSLKTGPLSKVTGANTEWDDRDSATKDGNRNCVETTSELPNGDGARKKPGAVTRTGPRAHVEPSLAPEAYECSPAHRAERLAGPDREDAPEDGLALRDERSAPLTRDVPSSFATSPSRVRFLGSAGGGDALSVPVPPPTDNLPTGVRSNGGETDSYRNNNLAPPPDGVRILRWDGGLRGASDVPHDVDLCLVSPCEFRHQRMEADGKQEQPAVSEPSSRGQGSPPPSLGDSPLAVSEPSSRDQESPPASLGDSLLAVPAAAEGFPSLAADSDQEPGGPLRPAVTLSLIPALHSSPDPPSALLKDPPPLPPQPEACMADVDVASRGPKASVGKTRKPAGTSPRGTSGSTGVQNLKAKAAASAAPKSGTLDAKVSARISPGGSRSASAKAPVPASKSWEAAVQVDLAYLPSGAASSTVDSDLFRRLRASYYVLSGEEPVKAAAMRSILDALLDGKSGWPDAQVTLIPTFDSAAMHEWYQETHRQQRQLSITVLGSNSTVAMQEETFPACKVEF